MYINQSMRDCPSNTQIHNNSEMSIQHGSSLVRQIWRTSASTIAWNVICPICVLEVSGCLHYNLLRLAGLHSLRVAGTQDGEGDPLFSQHFETKASSKLRLRIQHSLSSIRMTLSSWLLRLTFRNNLLITAYPDTFCISDASTLSRTPGVDRSSPDIVSIQLQTKSHERQRLK